MSDRDIIAAHTDEGRLFNMGDPDSLIVRCSCGVECGPRRGDHAAHVAAALRESRTVRTVEQLDALPEGTLIAHGGYVLRNRDFCGWWRQVQRLDGGLCDGYDVDQNHIALPALILWHPKDGAL